MHLTVFSSSSDAIDPAFFEIANELGRTIAERGDTLVYGGTNVGLMGAAARAVTENGGKVIGVIPRYMVERGIDFSDCEMHLTRDLRERKAKMETLGDAFVVLPGGFGTLEELLEILTLKQLRQHQKAIVILNANGFFDPLRELFEHVFRQRFAKETTRALYHFSSSVPDVFSYLDSYIPMPVPTKWFTPAPG
ncbi:MAG TPA: TIGR00730 family Rossman fold protein [Terriglobales bacterium]|nr:TIGR00730 family Rossman fold protein [Terriglobales bacterium]